MRFIFGCDGGGGIAGSGNVYSVMNSYTFSIYLYFKRMIEFCFMTFYFSHCREWMLRLKCVRKQQLRYSDIAIYLIFVCLIYCSSCGKWKWKWTLSICLFLYPLDLEFPLSPLSLSSNSLYFRILLFSYILSYYINSTSMKSFTIST